ncbi:MAG: hypothetical protein H6506_01410 [Calditrichaeota bacterium]|nr:hypothetical protein [Calditrichota bacterium]MCB9366453.1 hypothetical protein [Calditrichota bacterium]MCB9391289.1 hypothetical protein [Calditrichota bacterium]
MHEYSLLSNTRAPIPGWLLEISIWLCALVPFVLVLESSESLSPANIAASAVACLLGYFAWRAGPSFPGRETVSRVWMILAVLSTGAAMFGAGLASKIGVLTILWCALPAVLLFAHSRIDRSHRVLRQSIVPLLFGSIFMFVSTSLGQSAKGAFPAVIAALFLSVLRATLDIEEDVLENHGDTDSLVVEEHYRKRLAITAAIFFLFGTVSLWPWLGEVYSQTYFFIMLFGVLLPLAYFWGRIRQPKMEGARAALTRFNRIAPLLGIFHLVAVLFS